MKCDARNWEYCRIFHPLHFALSMHVDIGCPGALSLRSVHLETTELPRRLCSMRVMLLLEDMGPTGDSQDQVCRKELYHILTTITILCARPMDEHFKYRSTRMQKTN